MQKATTKKKSSSKSNRLLSVIGVLLCVIFGGVLLCNVMLILKSNINPDEPPSVLGVTPFTVLSGSMSGEREGHLEIGDLILVREVESTELEVGDVISFLAYGSVTTHRIIEISEENGQIQFITKGDANNVEDQAPVVEEQLVGQVVCRVPKVGNFVMFLRQPLGMVLFIVLPLLLFIFLDIYLQRRNGRKKKEEELSPLAAENARLRALLEKEGVPSELPEGVAADIAAASPVEPETVLPANEHLMKEQPVAEEQPVVEEQPVAEEQFVAEEQPVVEEQPVAEVVEEPAVEEPMRVAACEAAREKNPVMVCEPIYEETPASVPAPVSEPVSEPAYTIPAYTLKPASYLAAGTVWEGTLRASGDVEVAGEFKGDMITEGHATIRSSFQGNLTANSLALIGGTVVGDVIVADTIMMNQYSRIEGNVKAKVLITAGQIVGDLEISRSVTLEQSARIKGNLTTGSLAMARGALLSGGVEINP